MPPPKAVVALSGGLDSATTLAIARSEGLECHALTFRYGQRHEVEIEAARRVAAALGVAQHIIVDIDLRPMGASALTAPIEVPKGRSVEEMTGGGIPVTYVPARNTIFLAFALGWAEVLSAPHIYVGINALDYSGYPDCRPEYLEAFQRLARLATKSAVEGAAPTIHAPLLHWTKAEIVRRGLSLGVDYSLTRSCYDPSPDGLACGECDACVLRLRAFAENHLRDPAPYRKPVPDLP
jgi:7-cyano-7-deazaguanine synthase